MAVLVSGSDVADAEAGINHRTNSPVVNLKLNNSGTRKFAVATAANVGSPCAAVLDDRVLTVGVIREPIPSGIFQIGGSLTVETARMRVILLRSGPLPAEILVVEERMVPPSRDRQIREIPEYHGPAGTAEESGKE